jgi:putative hydrolase of the HAD superfamily
MSLKRRESQVPGDVQQQLLDCDTLMLDMDGTLLDLAYDNYVWLQVVPDEYARRRNMTPQDARQHLYAMMTDLRGTLDWYCLDFWSERLDLDIVGLHRSLNDRIGYLPGARAFLQRVASMSMRVLLVTNSHSATLDIKNEATGITQYFDGVYTSHDLGHPKEEQAFWQSLAEREDFDPARAVFVDDNPAVLDSARRFGVQKLLAVAEPDSTAPARAVDRYINIDRVSRLLAD